MKLLPLDDPQWATYRSGYREPYDTVALLLRLTSEGATAEFWEEVWSELHHQKDLGEASYAVVPYLVNYQRKQQELDARLFQFVCMVELQRPGNSNPPIPGELQLSYASAIRALPIIGAEKLRHGCSEEVIMGVAASCALAVGRRVLGRAYLDFQRADALVYLRDLNGFEASANDA